MIREHEEEPITTLQTFQNAAVPFVCRLNGGWAVPETDTMPPQRGEQLAFDVFAVVVGVTDE